MGLKYKVFIPLPDFFEEESPKINSDNIDRMMKKNEVAEVFHVSPTNPERHKIFDALTKYHNLYNKHAVYKASEVQELLSSLVIDRSKN